MNNHLRQKYLDAIGIQNWQLKSDRDNMSDDLHDAANDNTLQIIAQPQSTAGHEAQQISPEPQSFIIDPEQILPEAQPPAQTFNPSVKEEQREAGAKIIKTKIVEKVEQVEKEKREETIDPVLDPELVQAINNCKQCPERQTRLNALAGQGNTNASVFVISEAPNAEEDRCGLYLTEPSGSLFQSMLHSIDSQDNYFFTGIIKCYSLSGSLVSEDEINHCRAFLYAQIEYIKPSVLLVLGAAQVRALLPGNQTFNELRTKVHSLTINNTEYPLLISYHPAYLLRNPIYKREALKDLILLKKLLE